MGISDAVFTLKAILGLDSTEYESGLSGAKNLASKAGSMIGNGLATAAKVGAAALTAATGAAVAFGKSSIDAGMTFDKSMSQVAATMGKTVEELNEMVGEVDTQYGHFSGTLREFAQYMGSNSAFSASQAADALNYMALAGYDAQTSMEMLPNVLNLAAAGNIELAAASDMVTDASSALGLTLDETTLLVNKMAQASSKSNTSVAQLGDAILTVGGTAKNLAGGTTELSTVLGILADNSIKGAEGGTALRNIILALAAPTDTAAEAMKSIGLEAYNANGELRPMEEIFGDLNERLSTMTQGEQTNVLNQIFNKVDLRAANALLATSADRWAELSGAIDDAGEAAAQMAKTQLDNLAGDITLFQSALEGAKITVSDQLTPTLRQFVQFGTNGLTQLTEAFKEDGLDGAMEVFGNILSDALTKIVDGLPKAIQAGQKLITTFANGIKRNMPQIMTAAKSVTTMFLRYVSQALPEIMSFGGDIIAMIGEAIIDALPELSDAADTLVDTFVEFLSGDNFATLADGGMQILEAIGDAILRNLPKLGEVAKSLILGFIQFVTDEAPGLLNTGVEIISVLVSGIGSALPELLPAAASAIMTIATELLSEKNLKAILNAGLDLVKGLAEGIVKALPEIIKRLPELINGICDWLISDAVPDILSAGEELMGQLLDNTGEIIDSLVESVLAIVEGIVGLLTDDDKAQKIMQAGIDLLGRLLDKEPEILESLTTGITNLVVGLVNKLLGLDNKGKISGGGKDLMGHLADSWGDLDFSPQAETLIRYIVETLSGYRFFKMFFDVGFGFAQQIWEGIKSAFSGGTVYEGIVSFAEGKFGDNSGEKRIGSTGTTTVRSGRQAELITMNAEDENYLSGYSDSTANEIRALRQDVNEMTDAIGNMTVVLDTGETVGALATPMDGALGNQYTYRRRGVV